MKKLYGLGTGPGDPELLTLKAVKILKEANIIFAPLSKGKNMALDTVKEYVKDKEIVYLDFPMGSVTNEVYKENAEIIINNINEGESGVFITIGDPTFYSTFINMLEFLQNKIYLEIISGIPSFVAAAGRGLFPLAFTGEKFAVVDKIPKENPKFDSMVILKAYNLEEENLERLEDFGFQYKYLKRVTLPDEKIFTEKEDILREKDYISLILARRKKWKV